MPELQAAQAQLWEDWLAKLTEMVAELQAREVVRAERDPYALALLWSSVIAGLAAHHLANPEIELEARARARPALRRLPPLTARADRRRSARVTLTRRARASPSDFGVHRASPLGRGVACRPRRRGSADRCPSFFGR